MNECVHRPEESGAAVDPVGNPAANPFHLDIRLFKGPEPAGPLVGRDEFAALVRAQALIDEAAANAQQLLRDADLQAARLQASARLAAQSEAEQRRRDAVVSRGLQWLVDEARFEAAVIERIEGCVREKMTEVLQEWLAEQDRIVPLANRLAALVLEHARRRPYRIRLHPDECKRVIAQVAQGLLEGIDCVADAALERGQAVIDTEFLRIEFDLDRHWTAVLATLRGMAASISPES